MMPGMSMKTMALVSAGLAAGLLIANFVPSPVGEAEASMTDVKKCWIETRNGAQEFEDNVNKKVAEGYTKISYQYEIYISQAQVKEVYSALMCK